MNKIKLTQKSIKCLEKHLLNVYGDALYKIALNDYTKTYFEEYNPLQLMHMCDIIEFTEKELKIIFEIIDSEKNLELYRAMMEILSFKYKLSSDFIKLTYLNNEFFRKDSEEITSTTKNKDIPKYIGNLFKYQSIADISDEISTIINSNLVIKTMNTKEIKLFISNFIGDSPSENKIMHVLRQIEKTQNAHIYKNALVEVASKYKLNSNIIKKMYINNDYCILDWTSQEDSYGRTQLPTYIKTLIDNQNLLKLKKYILRICKNAYIQGLLMTEDDINANLINNDDLNSIKKEFEKSIDGLKDKNVKKRLEHAVKLYEEGNILNLHAQQIQVLLLIKKMNESDIIQIYNRFSTQKISFTLKQTMVVICKSQKLSKKFIVKYILENPLYKDEITYLKDGNPINYKCAIFEALFKYQDVSKLKKEILNIFDNNNYIKDLIK